jgi:hypothetical protein
MFATPEMQYQERTPELRQQNEERCVFKNNPNATSNCALSLPVTPVTLSGTLLTVLTPV